MKVIIKNLKQVTFEIEVPSAQSTVLDLKKAIEKERNFDSEQLKLLFLGVILDDAKKLEDYKIEEGSTIILMMSKVKVKNNDQPQPEQSANPKPNEEKKRRKKGRKKRGKKRRKTSRISRK
jgi:UV excision repair protein RAD23